MAHVRDRVSKRGKRADAIMDSLTATSRPNTKPWLGLVFVLASVSMIWLTILPRIGQVPTVRMRIESNQAAGINPTAVFYSDHPSMRETERKIESIVYHSDGAFWAPAWP